MKDRLACCVGLAGIVALAAAQEPTHMGAATHPGRGQTYLRWLLTQSTEKRGDEREPVWVSMGKIAYGIRSTLAVSLQGEVASRASDSERGEHRWGLLAEVRRRLFKHDLGPVNTWMASIVGSAELPRDSRGEAARKPGAGAELVTTAILGRHGLNAEAGWSGRPNGEDVVRLNASHLYRWFPATFRASTSAAWYSVIESLNDLGTDGTGRSEISVGVLYEARRWAWEVGLRLPLHEDDGRNLEWAGSFGLRFLP